MADQRIARRLTVSGRVQGVWFRGWTIDQARALRLDGWVRNRTDGTVEVLAAGPANAVERLMALCHGGPPHAQVTAVDSVPADDPGAIGFGQKPTT